MRVGLLAIVAVVLAGAGGPPPGDAEKLQGRWRVITARDSGRDAPEGVGDLSLVVTGDRMVMKGKGEKSWRPMTFKLDPAKKPRWIDLWIDKTGPFPGIYELDGDTLKICFNEVPPERSTRFVSEPNSPNDILLILTREKP